MPRRHLCLLAISLTACSTSTPEAGLPPEPPLPDDAFARPWAFVDGVAPDRPFDALVRVPDGFVAITHEPTNDGKARPERNNIAAFSSDGLSWEQHPLGDTVHARALAFGNGVIVAVGQRMGAVPRGSILTSTDGRTWQEVPGPDVGLMSLRFLEGQFWAFGELGAFFTSRDGRSWVDQSRWQSGQLNDVAFGHGRYVVVGNAVWLSSADGRTWEEHRSICGDLARCPGVVPPGGTPTGFPALFSVVFGNGTFVTDGGVGTWASSDGLTWTEAPTAVGGSVFSHGRFLARAEARNSVVASDDGRLWRDRTTIATTDRNRLSCQDHTCVVFPDGLMVIPNAADPPPIPRAPVLELDRSESGQTVTASPGQRILVHLQTIGPGEFGEPTLSSPAVRLVTYGYDPGPPTPAGPLQNYWFVAETPGHADLVIPHSGRNPPFELAIDVKAD